VCFSLHPTEWQGFKPNTNPLFPLKLAVLWDGCESGSSSSLSVVILFIRG
jgi:hypothetical protein